MSSKCALRAPDSKRFSSKILRDASLSTVLGLAGSGSRCSACTVVLAGLGCFGFGGSGAAGVAGVAGSGAAGVAGVAGSGSGGANGSSTMTTRFCRGFVSFAPGGLPLFRTGLTSSTTVLSTFMSAFSVFSALSGIVSTMGSVILNTLDILARQSSKRVNEMFGTMAIRLYERSLNEKESVCVVIAGTLNQES